MELNAPERISDASMTDRRQGIVTSCRDHADPELINVKEEF
jgi:hypothetical protein